MLWIVPPVVHPRGQSKSQSSMMGIIESTGQRKRLHNRHHICQSKCQRNWHRNGQRKAMADSRHNEHVIGPPTGQLIMPVSSYPNTTPGTTPILQFLTLRQVLSRHKTTTSPIPDTS